IRPISNTVEIFVTGLDAASLSFLASNLGLKSSTGSRYANDGISLSSSFACSFFSSSLLFNSIWCMMFSLVENIWKRTASHIFVALGVSLPSSGNLGSSCSTTMCFLSRDQPLTFDFTPFGFCMTLRRGSAAGRDSSPSFFSDAGLTAASAFLSFPLSSLSADSAAGTLVSRAGAGFEFGLSTSFGVSLTLDTSAVEGAFTDGSWLGVLLWDSAEPSFVTSS
uniref:Uncharacterized protein n=1 Tax=Lates calcarifer TaxID=8187 RepID=A0A4W6DKW0_LATCA